MRKGNHADALHCQSKTARLIAEKGGEYLLQVEGNQPGMLDQAKALAAAGSPFFSEPPSKEGALEERWIQARAIEPDALGMPFARSIVVLRCRRFAKKSGNTSDETRYYISSEAPESRSPAQGTSSSEGIGPAWRSATIGDATRS